jgi:catechol 2,3-dioxygenase-like lactoylglutathione lyase family enzyme
LFVRSKVREARRGASCSSGGRAFLNPRRLQLRYTASMIRQIVPVFFTTDIPRTAAYYRDKLGFECLGTWQDPPVYAIVARDGCAIHFRCAAPPMANPDKHVEELLDAYIYVEDADALFAEYAAKEVAFARGLGNMPWNCREFVVKDCDGRLLAFGSDL